MPYLFRQYNFQDAARAKAANEELHLMEEKGWEIHTAAPTFTEMSVLWHKPRKHEPEKRDAPEE